MPYLFVQCDFVSLLSYSYQLIDPLFRALVQPIRMGGLRACSIENIYPISEQYRLG